MRLLLTWFIALKRAKEDGVAVLRVVTTTWLLVAFAILPATAWLGEEKLAATPAHKMKTPTGRVHVGDDALAKFKRIISTSPDAGAAYRELTSAFGPLPIRLADKPEESFPQHRIMVVSIRE